MVVNKKHQDAWRGVEGYPWEIARPELAQQIGFYGHVEVVTENGKEVRRWVPGMEVKAMPWDSSNRWLRVRYRLPITFMGMSGDCTFLISKL